jgi:flagellar basal-body rod modification protein FlgD
MPFDISRIATPVIRPAADGNGTAGTTNGVDTVKTSASASDVFGLTKDDFFKLFLNQLKNQDPTSPMDDKDFLNQMAQFTMIDTLQQVNKSLGGTQLAQASALIGDQVIGTDTSGKAASGIVNRIVQDSTGIILVLDGGALVDPKDVTQVLKSSPATASGTSTATT